MVNSKFFRGRFWLGAGIGALLACSMGATAQGRFVSDKWQTAAEIDEDSTVVAPRRATRAEKREAPRREASEEMRGFWVVRDTLVSPQAIRTMVSVAAKNGINTLFVQVRGRGDAWYRSSFEPRAEQLSGQPADFDPLAFVIEEAHAKGIQVHAWLNTYLTWSGASRPESPRHLWNAHPEWFATERNGHFSSAHQDDCEGAFVQPSNPAVQKHLFNVFTEVARNYEVDGIHFDYCRYPNSRYDYSAPTLARFRDYMTERLSAEDADRMRGRSGSALADAFPKAWEDWRRAQVTGLISRIASAVREMKPHVQVSAAVYANGKEAAKYRGQDWQAWLQEGVLDSVSLMAYSKDTAVIAQQTREAVAAANGRPVYVGLGAWRLAATDVAQKISEARRAGASGINLFSYNSMVKQPGYLDTLVRSAFGERSVAISRPSLAGERRTVRTASREEENEETIIAPSRRNANGEERELYSRASRRR